MAIEKKMITTGYGNQILTIAKPYNNQFVLVAIPCGN
jgi:hypothetical protein